MIERKFVAQKQKEFQIQEYITETFDKVGHSHTKMKRTPLGEKIVIHASRPGLIVGKRGSNIKALTKVLKKRFHLENPQIEIVEVKDIHTDPQIVAEKIASSLQRFGSQRFKGIMHKAMEDTIRSGALGIEILISGKIPSSRAKTWRVVNGYLKKCGDVAIEGVLKAYSSAKLKTGVVGIQVRIMPPDIRLPDDIRYLAQEAAETAKKTIKISEATEAEKQTGEDLSIPDVEEVEEVIDLSEKIEEVVEDEDVEEATDEESETESKE